MPIASSPIARFEALVEMPPGYEVISDASSSSPPPRHRRQLIDLGFGELNTPSQASSASSSPVRRHPTLGTSTRAPTPVVLDQPPVTPMLVQVAASTSAPPPRPITPNIIILPPPAPAAVITVTATSTQPTASAEPQSVVAGKSTDVAGMPQDVAGTTQTDAGDLAGKPLVAGKRTATATRRRADAGKTANCFRLELTSSSTVAAATRKRKSFPAIT